MLDLSSGRGRRLAQRLTDERIIWLTTIGPDGTPYPSVVWFWWAGGEVLVYSQPRKPKLANIAASPKVALNFNSDRQGGTVGVLVGSARVQRSFPSAADHPEYREKYRGWIEAGPWKTAEGFAADYSVPILIRPEAFRSW